MLAMTSKRTYSAKTARLLEAIRACGPGWVTRAQISAQLGKNRLNGSEATVLEALVAQGILEAERHEIDAPISMRWEYRLR